MNNKNQETHNNETSKKKEKNKKKITENKKENTSKKTKENNQKKNLINSELDQLKKQLSDLQKKERDTLLRAKAEVENNLKRTKKEIQRIYKFALENFINELLPVIDNLERAISILDKNKVEFVSTLEGVQLTLKSFLKVIKKHGVSIIYENNVPFNPKLHQAVTTKETNEKKENQVIEIIQKGYILNGRLLRPAMVIVSKKNK